MERNEDKQVTEMIEAYTAAIQLFQKKEYKAAAEAFKTIAENNKDSEHGRLLEISSRARAHQALSEARLNPLTIELNEDEDYLMEGLYQINSGDYQRALELLGTLEEKGYKDTYVSYLMALAHLKQENRDTCMEYLKKVVAKDSFYRIIAYNEPAFHEMFESEAFVELMEQ